MKYFILIFALIFSSCAANKIHKQTDRERDGFSGRVANVYISTVFPTKGKCPKSSDAYDEEGKLTKHKVYTKGCGTESITTDYEYFSDGRRVSTAPGAEKSTTTFTFDANGRLLEETTAFNNQESVKNRYSYDESGRIKEKTFFINDAPYGKEVYEYTGDQKAPAKFSYTENKTGKIITVTYTNYEFNSEGDWIKREESEGGKVSFVERAIEYYKE